MILGFGIDLTELDRIRQVAERQSKFVDRVLTAGEQKQYELFHGQRAIEYLGGRWSLKESFAKALQTGIGASLGFHDVEILDNNKGAPVVTKSPFNGHIKVSVSHTAGFVMTAVILEEENGK
ncbi:holo-ACP synthase [uncultured Limosilactobacillus sp.]|uniref:holo-ACP synthase n=1 Tax=uncultured Limosilactobacillus sp. TaxID=2837629 RepID=UPI0025DE910F|nr:holo-ACP synthase [uncultured Limosilactobacillus sp.]